MTGTLRIVPREATKDMAIAGEIAVENNIDETQDSYQSYAVYDEMVLATKAYEAMLAAAPRLTDDQIDALCRMMWQNTVSPPEHYTVTREQRARMRAFVEKLNG